MDAQFVSFANLVMLSLVPYTLASLGIMLGGRTGIFNVATEGIMLAAASVGFVGAYLLGSLVYGLLAAMLVGGLFGLALAYFTTTLKMNQFVIGLALFFFGLGLSTLVNKLVVGVTLTLPRVPTFQPIPIPGLNQIPVLGNILFNHNLMVYIAVLLAGGLYYLLYRTSFGLELRAVGENPKAADSLGINVSRMQYLTTITGSMLMGLAGVYLPMAYTGAFTEGIVNGRGWLSIALTFFGGWSPLTIFAGSLFFAGTEVFSRWIQVGDTGIPYQFLGTIPFIVTILIMMPTFRRVRVPAFLGQNYDREKRTQV